MNEKLALNLCKLLETQVHAARLPLLPAKVEDVGGSYVRLSKVNKMVLQ